MEMGKKSKVLVVGGTGYIGRWIVKASLAQGHETYVLQRRELWLRDIEKVQMLLSFKEQGAHLVEASFSDHQSLVHAVKQVQVVICAMSGVHLRSHNILMQLKLVDAIKEAGTIKRFLPSEFGTDPSRMEHALEPSDLAPENSMEKPSRTKSNIFAFLPKTARVSFSNPPFSPGAEKKIHHKAFSGPIISIIPAEARTKQRNGSFEGQEPTSPKVSCIGQIKHKQKMCKAKCKTPPPKPKAEKKTASAAAANKKTDKKQSFNIGKILRGRGAAKRDGKVEADARAVAAAAAVKPARAPALGQMKRFASGRDTLADFDWKEFAGPAGAHRRGYYSDDDKNLSEEEEFEDDIDDDGFGVPHSAPLAMMGGPPRKEINLWKRRTMAPPRPLELNSKAKK